MEICDFKVGSYYKLEEMRKVLGGPLLSSIATKNNQILYVKFKKNKIFNPKVPDEIWIKNGPTQIQSAESWVEKNQSTMMFYMDTGSENKKWKYMGLVVPKIIYKGQKAINYTNNDKISMVLKVSQICINNQN